MAENLHFWQQAQLGIIFATIEWKAQGLFSRVKDKSEKLWRSARRNLRASEAKEPRSFTWKMDVTRKLIKELFAFRLVIYEIYKIVETISLHGVCIKENKGSSISTLLNHFPVLFIFLAREICLHNRKTWWTMSDNEWCCSRRRTKVAF